MKHSWRTLRALTALLLAGSIACPPAFALVTLNDGHDRISVSASMGVSHDSNVFAANGGAGDLLYTTSFSAAYQRRAGWIGVSANIGISGGHYGSLQDQDFSDPSMSIEFNKQTGRTTGSLSLSAARESRADPAINMRSQSWNYTSSMSFRYHIVGTYDLSGSFGYSQRKYLDDISLTNLATFSSSFDLSHPFSAERDAIVGYRYRYNETSRNTSSSDHNFTLGLQGKLIRGINGTVRVGYQFRVPDGRVPSTGQFQSWSAATSASYTISKRISLGGTISKDFSTTATDSSVDALTASLDATYALNSKISFNTSASWGDSRFLGESGRPVISAGPPVILGPERHDSYVSLTASTGYSLNQHLRLGLIYAWFQNWSSSEFADFNRSSWSFNLSSQW